MESLPMVADEALDHLGRTLYRRSIDGLQVEEMIDRLKDNPCWSSVSWLYHWMTGAGSQWLRCRCLRALQGMGRPIELEPAELLDEFLPDFRLRSGELALPYGGRGTFRIAIDDESKIHVYRDRKELSSLPPPLVADDPAKIDAIRSSVTAFKREIRRAAKLVDYRLEQAVRHSHSWPPNRWRDLMANPVFRNPGRHLLWGVFTYPATYDEVFMVDETGCPVGLDDGPVELGQDTTVRAIKPELLRERDRTLWGNRFGEYELLTDQFRRPEDDLQGSDAVGINHVAVRWCDLFEEERDLLLEEFARADWTEAVPDTRRPFSSRAPFAAKTFDEDGPITAVVSVGVDGCSDLQYCGHRFDRPLSEVPLRLREGVLCELRAISKRVTYRIRRYDPERER